MKHIVIMVKIGYSYKEYGSASVDFAESRQHSKG